MLEEVNVEEEKKIAEAWAKQIIALDEVLHEIFKGGTITPERLKKLWEHPLFSLED